MAAGCPLGDGPAGRSCGCRPRRYSSRESSRCRWPGACGSAPSRRTSGGGAGGSAVRLRWHPGARAGRRRLDERQLARLRAALDLGAAAYGWGEDQRWTLARVTALMVRLFHLHYTLRGTSYLLHRMGFSPQVPVHRAAERDEAAIAAGWDLGDRGGLGPGRSRRGGLGPGRSRRGGLGPGRRYEASGGDRGVCVLRGRGRAVPAPVEGLHLGPRVAAPPWSPCPTRARAGSRSPGWCASHGARGRIMYRLVVHHGRKGERSSLSEADYANLITAAHHLLHARSSAGTT